MFGFATPSPDIYYHGPVMVFDLDDTLFAERDFCRSGFRFLASRVKSLLGTWPENLVAEMEEALENRQSPFNVFEDRLAPLFRERNIPFSLNDFISEYRAHCPESLSLLPQVEETLMALSSKKIVMGLITDGRSVTQRSKIEALAIQKFFPPENILISEEIGFDKTSPEPFAFFMRKYPEAREFVYVGDNPSKDFLQPNLLGWTTFLSPSHPDRVHPLVYPQDNPLCSPTSSLPSWSALSCRFKNE